MEISGRRTGVYARALLGRVSACIWPPTCVLCGGSGRAPATDLCAECEADLPLNLPACAMCAEPLAGNSSVHLLCGECIRRKPKFDRATCAFRYAYPVDHLVRGLKYRNAVAYARVLGDLLATQIAKRCNDLPDFIVPVPLADQRFRTRGYNQALEIGRRLERRLGIPMITDAATRTRETSEQAGLDQKARRRNIRGAFAIAGKFPAANIAIIDDVITTGSTANELARVLKRAGAKRVQIWAVARAGR
ncbi:MAG: double zinc ribbon domain-containing protein [Povalibacter sp.]